MANEKEVKQKADAQRKENEKRDEQVVENAPKDNEGNPLPRLVQSPGQLSEDELLAENEKTPSARAQFVAGPLDGIWNPEQQQAQMGDPASRQEQVAAFAEYVERPDIESRQSILAREMALPAQFSGQNVRSGSVTDGRVGENAPGFGKDDDEAKAEADSVKDNTAYKG